MARLIILGAAAAVSTGQNDNVHFVMEGDHGSVVLVDCSANPINKLPHFDIDPLKITELILTHFHPDHVCALPLLLMQPWLMGRRAPLPVYGLHHCLTRSEQMMDLFGWREWDDFYGVDFHYIPEAAAMPVLDNDDFRITSWHTRHFIPTIGLRIEVKSSGKVIAYSGDTAPTPRIVDLAQEADLLIHEASGGPSVGHSSAAEAGQIATQARAKRLALIHYPVWHTDPTPLVDEARTTFDGPVELAQDGSIYEI